MELGPHGALHAMLGPRPALLREGRVSGRVEVLRRDDVIEARHQPVDDLDDVVAVGDGERAARDRNRSGRRRRSARRCPRCSCEHLSSALPRVAAATYRVARMGEFVSVERQGAVAVIRLDRPKVNALNVQVVAELNDACAEIEGDRVDPRRRRLRRRADVLRRGRPQGDGRRHAGRRPRARRRVAARVRTHRSAARRHDRGGQRVRARRRMRDRDGVRLPFRRAERATRSAGDRRRSHPGCRWDAAPAAPGRSGAREVDDLHRRVRRSAARRWSGGSSTRSSRATSSISRSSRPAVRVGSDAVARRREARDPPCGASGRLRPRARRVHEALRPRTRGTARELREDGRARRSTRADERLGRDPVKAANDFFGPLVPGMLGCEFTEVTKDLVVGRIHVTDKLIAGRDTCSRRRSSRWPTRCARSERRERTAGHDVHDHRAEDELPRLGAGRRDDRGPRDAAARRPNDAGVGLRGPQPHTDARSRCSATRR